MEFVIRRYREGEEEAIWEIVFQAMRISNARDYHPDLIERWAPRNKDMAEWRERLGTTRPFVAVAKEELLGMGEIDSRGFIDFFYVHPDFERRGVGRALMATLEGEARREGAEELRAFVSVTARPFFLACGFVVERAQHHRILGHPAPNFVMTKVLAPRRK